MASHGYSPEDLAVSVLSWLEADDYEAAGDPESCYGDWEYSGGFGGEIWACFEEFLGAEYLDRDYMSRLLPKDLLAKYDASAGDARKE